MGLPLASTGLAGHLRAPKKEGKKERGPSIFGSQAGQETPQWDDLLNPLQGTGGRPTRGGNGEITEGEKGEEGEGIRAGDEVEGEVDRRESA